MSSNGTDIVLKRIETLRKKRQEILALPPEKALAGILEADQPVALVHSFPEEDLHFLIQDIGAESALPVIAMASARQLDYILDIETWEKDRLHNTAVTRWLSILLASDPIRLTDWLVTEKKDLLQLYLFRCIEVRIREHDQDPSDFGDGFFTYDDVYYLRILEDQADTDAAEENDRELPETVKNLLDRMATDDHVLFQKMILEAAAVLPAETEEEMFRLRNVRLAEKGFLPFDEAIGIYQSLPANFRETIKKPTGATAKREGPLPPVPLSPYGVMDADGIFARALADIGDPGLLYFLQSEFAGLCNRIVVADTRVIRSREELRDIVKKACGYLSIGLEQQCNGNFPGNGGFAELLGRVSLSTIFRAGFQPVLELKTKVRRFRDQSWFETAGLPLRFWGEEWLGVLGGLLLKKPLFFDNYRSGELYREFESMQDIRETASILEDIVETDRLFGSINVGLEESLRGIATYKNLLLTLWARDCLALSGTIQPLTLGELKAFFGELFQPGTVVDAAGFYQGTIAERKKTEFLEWAAVQLKIDVHVVSRKLGTVFTSLFQELEAEYGRVAPDDIDPRYISHFLISV